MSSILTNTSAMVALQTIKSINSSLAKTQDEISTGKTVATAKDNAAYWRAKEGELARTILAVPEVKTARVHISQAPDGPFRRDEKPTASVTVTTSGGRSGNWLRSRGCDMLPFYPTRDKIPIKQSKNRPDESSCRSGCWLNLALPLRRREFWLDRVRSQMLGHGVARHARQPRDLADRQLLPQMRIRPVSPL